MKELIISLGYIEVASKNPYMISFVLEEDRSTRVNVYTNGTVTLQSPALGCKTIKEATLEDVEVLLN